MTDAITNLSDAAHDTMVDVFIAVGSYFGSTGNGAALYDPAAIRELIHARLIQVRPDGVVVATSSMRDYDALMGDV